MKQYLKYFLHSGHNSCTTFPIGTFWPTVATLKEQNLKGLTSCLAPKLIHLQFFFFFKKIQYHSVHGLWLIVSRQKEQLRQRASSWVFPERNLLFHTRIYPFENSMPISLSDDLKGPYGFTRTELPWKIIETTFRPYTCTLNLPKFARKFLLIVSIVQYIHRGIQTPF